MRVLCLFNRGVADLFYTVKDYIFVALYSLDLSVTAATLGPFIRGKIRRVLNKTRTFRINGTFRLK